MSWRSVGECGINLTLVGAVLLGALIGSGCATEADVGEGEQIEVDAAALGVSSVIRRAAGDYELIGPNGTSIGVVSLTSEPAGTTLSATLDAETGSLSWSSDALSGGCGDASAVLAVRSEGGQWDETEAATSVSLDACADALKVAAIVAEAEGVLVPLGPELRPDTSAPEPGQSPQMLECPGGTNWVWGGSCSRCFRQMKMTVGASGSITIACDPGWTWTACSWSSC